MFRLIFILFLSFSFIADAAPKSRVILNENYGTVMSYEQFKKYEREGQIKEINTYPDTIKVKLRGPKVHIPDMSEYNRSYSAHLSVNGKNSVYKKIEIPSYTPKSTQYNLSDSCFYLTFSLSPQFQTKGVKMDVSVFLFCDTIPCKGQKFQVITPSFCENNPIMDWTKDIGYVAIMQIGYFPEAKELLSKEHLSDSIHGKRIVLSSTDFTGELEVLSVTNAKHHDPLKLELKINANSTLYSDIYEEIKIPMNINGRINLFQIEKADIVPCYFEIDYGWPEYLISPDAFD